jgi:hypothetical protein
MLEPSNSDKNLQELYSLLQKQRLQAASEASQAVQTANTLGHTCDLLKTLTLQKSGESSGDLLSIRFAEFINPSGSYLIETARKLESETDQSVRALYAGEIQSGIANGISGFIASLPQSERDNIPAVVKILQAHEFEILSLEQSLDQKLRDYRHPHLNQIFQSALQSYRDSSNTLRFTNAGNGLRELIRELFIKIAPDQELKRCSWFVPNKESKTGVTRAHRIRFAIFSYLSEKDFPESFCEEVDSLCKEILESIDELSKLTHVTKEVLDIPEPKAIQILNRFLQSFSIMLDVIKSSRAIVADLLYQEIQFALDELFTEAFFQELDSLSSHTRPQSAENVGIKIVNISSDHIEFSGKGSVFCHLQYGSDGDCARGDGVETEMSFPFTFEGKAKTNDPSEITVDRDLVKVDVSSFYE